MSIVVVLAFVLVALLAGLVLVWAFWHDWPRLAIVLLTFSVYLSQYKYDVGPVTIRAEQVAILLLAGLLGLRFLVWGKWPRVSVPVLYAGGWWLALALGAYLHAPDFGDTVRHIIRLALMILGCVVTINLVDNEEDWRRLLTFLYGFGLLEAAYGLLAWLVYVSGIFPNLNLGVQVATSLPVPVPYGTIEEGNIFGSTMGALLLLSLALWLHPRGVVSRRASGLGIVLTGIGWLLSLARGAWLGVAFALPLLWLLYPRHAQRRFVHLSILLVVTPLALLVVLALILYAPPTWPVIARLQTLARLEVDPTFSLRTMRWGLAWQDFLQRPFVGWGPATFEQLHGLQRSRPAWLDSLTFKALQEAGLFGLIFLYGFWATCLFSGLRTVLKAPDRTTRGAVLGLMLGGVVLFLAYHATDASWLAFVWVWMGALIAHPGSMWVVEKSDGRTVEQLGG